MEIITGEPSELQVELNRRAKEILLSVLIEQPDKWIRDTFFIPEVNSDELEKSYKMFETKISEADLKDIVLEYIPDYIRDLKTKSVYWYREFRCWEDDLSENNWKLYNKKVKDEVKRHKTILKNMDNILKLLKRNSEDLFSKSLDPERVHKLVTSIKENEGDDKPFVDMMRAEEAENDLVQTFYIMYAIYARYGEFRVRPSRKNCLRVKEESEPILK